MPGALVSIECERIADEGADQGESLVVLVRLNCDFFLVEPRLSEADRVRLIGFLESKRKAYCYAGTACRNRVTWATDGDDGVLNVSIGEDMDSWDVCVGIDASCVPALIQALKHPEIV